MRTINLKRLLLLLVFLTSTGTFSQEQEVIYATMAKTKTKTNQKQNAMKTYVIEREIPNAGQLSEEQLQGISQKSNEVISELGPKIEWVHSYVTDNKVYCVYKAESQEIIKKHALKGGFPANAISELSATIDPSTAN